MCGGILIGRIHGFFGLGMTILNSPRKQGWIGAVLSLLLVLWTMGTALAQSISQVVIQGNQRVEAETIRSYIALRPGQAYDAGKVDESLKALFATGLFSDVSINRSGNAVVVRVVENPIVDKVAFEGNKKIESSDLLKETQIQAHGTYTRQKIEADVQRIIEVYRRQGRFDVKVEPKLIDLPNNRVNVVFEITEGEKTKVEKIAFIGNQAFSDFRLRDVITTTESNWLSFLKTSDIYDPERLSVDQELLRRYYLKNGYADFRVVSAVADYDNSKNAFFITFTLEEGRQYRFGKIDIESSIPSIRAEEYRGEIKSSPGDVYNAELIDKSLESVGEAIAKRGYPFSQVRPRGERDAASGIINVTYVIEEGPRLYVDRVNIVNNTRTQDRVIRREIDIAEGDAFNRVLVDRAEKRLNRLGYFKKVNITKEPGSTPDRVNLNVNVEEQSTGDLSFSAGYATVDGIIGEVGITERNFLGRGQYMKADVGLGTHRSKAELSFTEPYFLDRRLALGFDAYYRDTTATSVSSFEQQIYGAGTRLGISLTEDLSTQFRINGYEQRIVVPAAFQDCPLVPTPACLANGEASKAIIQSQGSSFVAMTGTSLIYNRLDNVRNPSNGYFLQGNLDVAGVSGHNAFTGVPNADFFRTTGEARGYYPIYGDFVGMLKVQGGTITSLQSGNPVRLVDTFFKGGEFIRGFQNAGIGPRDETAGLRQDSLGGTIYYGGTGELQFPIPYAPEDLGLKGALFLDAGTLYKVGNLNGTGLVKCAKGTALPLTAGSGCNYFDDSTIRASTGLSIIWQGSPLGPIRFDFGIPIQKQPYDQTEVFRFSGGTSF
jgi:outer membrane protein insertion porin family